MIYVIFNDCVTLLPTLNIKILFSAILSVISDKAVEYLLIQMQWEHGTYGTIGQRNNGMRYNIFLFLAFFPASLPPLNYLSLIFKPYDAMGELNLFLPPWFCQLYNLIN